MESSNFVKYFRNNFEELELKDLLISNGLDFRSKESIELLKQSDIVVTNPPFSLFREYVAQLIEYEKKFLIIGNFNTVINKNIFNYIKQGKLFIGYNYVKDFKLIDGSIKKLNNVIWFTNLINKPNKLLPLNKLYNPEYYPNYDGHSIINVDKLKDIPKDYYGIMGVPVTYLIKHCQQQFEIVGTTNNKHEEYISFNGYVNGKKKYNRILIKRKLTNETKHDELKS